jgi:predicted N-formylglutamate amidohydrolase
MADERSGEARDPDDPGPAGRRPLHLTRPRVTWIVSCEHAGNRVPAVYRRWFAGAEATQALSTHRGYDIGANRLHRAIADAVADARAGTPITRLLVDANRSIGHPSHFSEFSRAMPEALRERAVREHWAPHRRAVEDAVSAALQLRGWAVHLGIHTFSPVFKGRRRDTDVGILHDPHRLHERAFSAAIRSELSRRAPELVVRFNRPYWGMTDGLTTALRRRFPERYLGIELEVSQRFFEGPGHRNESAMVITALRGALGGLKEAWSPAD